jgi:hypothetical protein
MAGCTTCAARGRKAAERLNRLALPDDNYYHPARATVKLRSVAGDALSAPSAYHRVIRDRNEAQIRCIMMVGSGTISE